MGSHGTYQQACSILAISRDSCSILPPDLSGIGKSNPWLKQVTCSGTLPRSRVDTVASFHQLSFTSKIPNVLVLLQLYVILPLISQSPIPKHSTTPPKKNQLKNAKKIKNSPGINQPTTPLHPKKTGC